MKTSKKGRALIEKHEGRRRAMYMCPAGFKTIGIGHKLTEKELTSGHIEITMPEWPNTYYRNWETTALSDIEIECLFTQDLRGIEIALTDYIVPCNPGINQNQLDALVSFIFNIGWGRFLNSDSYELLRNGEYKKAMHVIIQWHNIKGELSNGLLDRRMSEIELFYEGSYDREYWEAVKLEILNKK